MKKILLPIINLVNVVLVSIVFGLGSNPAYKLLKVTKETSETWYSLVWMPTEKGANVVGIIGFFLFIFAVAGILITFIPFKSRKCVNFLIGAGLIASGVLFLLTPAGGYRDAIVGIQLTDSLIAMAVLVFIAGAFQLFMSVLEFLPEKKAN